TRPGSASPLAISASRIRRMAMSTGARIRLASTRATPSACSYLQRGSEMFVAEYRRTMAGASRVVADTPIDLKKKVIVEEKKEPPKSRVIIRLDEALERRRIQQEAECIKAFKIEEERFAREQWNAAVERAKNKDRVLLKNLPPRLP